MPDAVQPELPGGMPQHCRGSDVACSIYKASEASPPPEARSQWSLHCWGLCLGWSCFTL